MPQLNETLERDITICARRETVFRYFTDSERFAAWWGAGSRIYPKPGGEVLIRYPDGTKAIGEILEIEPPARIMFTYGYAGMVPAEFSRVTITLDETEKGTEVHLHHAFSSAKIRDHHVQGWRYQLALFSKTVSADQHSGAAARVDECLRAWGDPDAAERRRLLESCTADDVVFLDAFSATSGRDDLLANLEAIQTFMPGVQLTRDGGVRVTHGTAIARWVATRTSGERFGAGTNVYDFAPDGRIARVVGFWDG